MSTSLLEFRRADVQDAFPSGGPNEFKLVGRTLIHNSGYEHECTVVRIVQYASPVKSTVLCD